MRVIGLAALVAFGLGLGSAAEASPVAADGTVAVAAVAATATANGPSAALAAVEEDLAPLDELLLGTGDAVAREPTKLEFEMIEKLKEQRATLVNKRRHTMT
jgi:hypothetical protein